tara:strand:+ start:5796 stop:7409 length:1614 start_codon:yes stop_codon:yes gene_type:complete
MDSSNLEKFVLNNSSRLLSCIDRRPNSRTFGCSDRNYWHYKIVDFPCAMLQETSLTLALLYSIDFNNNNFYKSHQIKEIALSQLEYWKIIQNKNGSFDEFYPNEQSFSATAFTLYSSCYTMQLLKNNSKEFYDTSKKACDFLINYGDPGASNQVAAAIAAINIFSELYSDDSFDTQLIIMLDKLMESQSNEGWTPEYGGFDVGYQSITLSYLSDYCRRKPNQNLSSKLLNMISFLSYFIHPDGSVGGDYGSRNTSFLVPFGFAFYSDNSEDAAAVISKVFLDKNSNLNHSIDDRYVCHFILPSYLKTIEYLKGKDFVDNDLPYQISFSKKFNDSGFWIESNKNCYFICSIKKQGVFKLFSKSGQGVISDLGYIAISKNEIALTNWINQQVDDIELNKNSLIIKGSFFTVSNKVPNSFYHFMLRIASFFFGRRLLPILKSYFINRNKKLKAALTRKLIFDESTLLVSDEISFKSTYDLNLFTNENSSFRYVAPSNYFEHNQLCSNNSLVKQSFVNGKMTFAKLIDLKNFNIDKNNHET